MNIPNFLTSIRFILIPLFVYLFFSNHEQHLLYSFYVFLLAGITDVLDGYIARKFNMITDLGKLLDPLADKFMLISVLICLTTTQLVPNIILIVIIIKEVVMVAGGLYLYYSHMNVVIPSNVYGKIATFVFYVGICSVLLQTPSSFSAIVLYLAVAIAVIAFLNYLLIAIKHKKEL